MTASGSPRRICNSEARVKCLAPAKAVFPISGWQDVGAHEELMLAARDDAKLVLERDPRPVLPIGVRR